MTGNAREHVQACAPVAETQDGVNSAELRQSDDELEAIELRQHKPPGTSYANRSAPQHSQNTPALQPTGEAVHRAPLFDAVRRFQIHYVALRVPHNDCRDHLANERTYLAYLRTSASTSIMGITVTQLLRLEHSINPSPIFGFYLLGRPVGALFQIVAVMVAIIGTHRFLRQQISMARGKVWASGWELYAIGGALLLLTVAVFVLMVAVDISKYS